MQDNEDPENEFDKHAHDNENEGEQEKRGRDGDVFILCARLRVRGSLRNTVALTHSLSWCFESF